MNNNSDSNTKQLESAFLSYAHVDKPVVTLIAQILSAVNVEVLWDGSLKPGQLWQDVLLDWLDKADMAFVFWSANASGSAWVKVEFELLAGNCKKPLVPVLLDGSSLPPLLKERQWIDMSQILDQWSKRYAGYSRYPVAQIHRAGVSLRKLLAGESNPPDYLLGLDMLDLYNLLNKSSMDNADLAVEQFLTWHALSAGKMQ